MNRRAAAARELSAIFFANAPAAVPPRADGCDLNGEALLSEIAHRAFLYFWQKADERTGLVNDRASNTGKDAYVVASIAATGYGLAALPIGVENGWVTRADAARRARTTLAFLVHDLPHIRGWFCHFIDRRTGARAWRCEVSSMDTVLLVAGALVCGRYFAGTDIAALADRLYRRLDWTWMRTNGGARPDKMLVSHGWTPERGFLPYDWDTYSEGLLLYLLGLGAPGIAGDPLPAASWAVWSRPVVRYKERETLTGGPVFLHQMAQGFFDLRNRRDRLGWDYGVSAVNGAYINREYCRDLGRRRSPRRRRCGCAAGHWGLNAGDGPRGYRAYAGPGGVGDPEDGTLSPTGAIASVMLTPEISIAAAESLYGDAALRSQIWGRFGFANAFNLDQHWYGDDVIGIDLGMALVAIENHRSGLVWRLTGSHPCLRRACAAAGLESTDEPEPRPLFRPAADITKSSQFSSPEFDKLAFDAG